MSTAAVRISSHGRSRAANEALSSRAPLVRAGQIPHDIAAACASKNRLEPVAQLEKLSFTTKDHKEAIDALLEKREPKFTGP